MMHTCMSGGVVGVREVEGAKESTPRVLSSVPVVRANDDSARDNAIVLVRCV